MSERQIMAAMLSLMGVAMVAVPAWVASLSSARTRFFGGNPAPSDRLTHNLYRLGGLAVIALAIIIVLSE